MNGTFSSEINQHVTHLIANSSNGSKFMFASFADIEIKYKAWIEMLWKMPNIKENVSDRPKLQNMDSFDNSFIYDKANATCTGMCKVFRFK